jgi:hypothetical protein
MLTGYFSQTYRPGHHNSGDSFVFEPHLDPGVPEFLKAELDRLGIRYIFYTLQGPLGILYAAADGDFTSPVNWLLGEVEVDPWGNHTSPWLGTFTAGHFPLIQHEGLGWLHVDGAGPGDLWLYQHGGEGWLWTRADHYPACYSPARRAWLRFIPESAAAAARWWFDYDARQFHGAPVIDGDRHRPPFW